MSTQAIPTAGKWTGRVLSGLVIAFLVMDAGMKLVSLPIVIETSSQLGWSAGSEVSLGIILSVATLLYAIPRTSVLGAMLLTAYLGGAVATHLRLANPLFTHTLFGVYIGVMLWVGLWLRNPQLRRVVPLQY